MGGWAKKVPTWGHDSFFKFIIYMCYEIFIVMLMLLSLCVCSHQIYAFSPSHYNNMFSYRSLSLKGKNFFICNYKWMIGF